VHGHRSRGDIGYDRPFSPEDEPVHRTDSIGRGFPQEEVPDRRAGSDFYDRGYDSGGPDGSSRHARGGAPQLERRDSRQQPQHHQRVAFDDFAVADGHEGYYVEDEPGYGMVVEGREPPGDLPNWAAERPIGGTGGPRSAWDDRRPSGSPGCVDRRAEEMGSGGRRPSSRSADGLGDGDGRVEGAARADNILCAVLALIKELDRQGLELVKRAVEQRQSEL